MKRNRQLTLLLLFLTGCSSGIRKPAATAAQMPDDGAHWEPVVKLRDDTGHFPGTPDRPKPDGGWWVTPIHATLLPDGEALVTGWGRFDFSNCQIHRTRQNGESYLIDPSILTGGNDRTLMITPLDEQPRPGTQDVLYCAGNLTLPDGRVLMVGGARYKNLGDNPGELEYGLNYFRLFDPATRSFSRVEFSPKGSPAKTADMDWYENGMMWYPTETRLPGGKVLVVGGFDRNCGNDGSCYNRDIEIFDPSALATGGTPWSTWLGSNQAPADAYDPGMKDYAHSFLLPRPMPASMGGGRSRDILLMGWAGKFSALSLDSSLTQQDRIYFPQIDAFARPGGAAAWDSSAALVGTGEIMIVGGGANAAAEAQRIDLFNPQTGTWRSRNTGITRHNPATTLLPDGTVLIINGEQGDDTTHAMGDRHQPQIYDPYADQLTNLNSWPDSNPADRGYHSFSLLLKDGRILLGGGMVTLAQVGCERPDLRIFNPPYLSRGPRPRIDPSVDGSTLSLNATMSIAYSGPDPRSDRGVVLMAMGSETHSFDQNQRYIPLDFTIQSSGRLTLRAPNNSTIAPEGEYILYLISDAGVPSEGRLVHLSAPVSLDRLRARRKSMH